MDPLSQLRSLQTGQTAITGAPGQSPQTASTPEGGSFKDVLMKNLGEVNQLQQDADKQIEDFVSKKTQNLDEVISASQKASMAFSMLTQIRNKLQDAYDEVKNLRV